MTTHTSFNTILHNTDAEFRAWVAAVSAHLQGIGLVKTTDTGQIDTATVLRPVANVYGGYEIYRFNDALQATRPIFFKLEYGTASTSTAPQMRITVGTGSNGSGTITGIMINNLIFGRGTTPLAGNASNSYSAKVDALGGFMCGLFLQSVSTVPTGYFVFGIQRPCDDNGVPTDEGVILYANSASTLAFSVWSFITNSLLVNNNTYFSFVPGGIGTTSYGSDVQGYRHMCPMPRTRHLPMMLTVMLTEFTRGTVFQTAVLGGTTRTFIALGDSTQSVGLSGSAAHVLAFVYE